MRRKLNWLRYIVFAFVVSCAAVDRDCSSCNASNFGSDWLVLQYGFDGTPINCWRLQNTAMSNESQTDGIYWKDPGGHLVHISGWYNRVQVDGGRYDEAAKAIGIDLASCTNGKYQPVKETKPVMVTP